MPSSQLISEAERAGISERTLKKAKSNLPIRPLKKVIIGIGKCQRNRRGKE